jgi:bacteriophage N4 adsorption protein B
MTILEIALPILVGAVTLLFLLGGLDDLFCDLVFFLYRFKRFRLRRDLKAFEFEHILRCPEKKLAVFVPCWQEEGVVDKMVDHALRTIRYRNYALFIGCYPNDEGTIESAKAAAFRYPHLYVIEGNRVSIVSPPVESDDPPVYVVVGDRPGPTSKADNLNQVFEAMQRIQNPLDPFEFIVIHDSEDLIHPWSFSLFSYLVSRGKHMVQIPVLPLPTPLTDFVHWSYVDEFAEHHSRTLVAREQVGGFVPSAGTGTAYTVEALRHLARKNGVPFNTRSLTEDYQSGLDLEAAGYQTIFVQMNDPDGHLIATYAYFPRNFVASVRQRTRWLIGIALQGAEYSGWKGDLATKYCLLRDRKILITAYLNLFAYAFVPLVLLQNVFGYRLTVFSHPAWFWLAFINAGIAVWRLAVRTSVVWSLYGWKPALWVVPRAVLGNVINAASSLRATYQYLSSRWYGTQLRWDKTAHEFPDIRITNRIVSTVRAQQRRMEAPHEAEMTV